MNDTAQDKKNELRQMMHERGAIDADDNLTDAGRNYLSLLNWQLETQRLELASAQQSLERTSDLIAIYHAFDDAQYERLPGYQKRFNQKPTTFEPTPEEIDTVLNDVFTAMATAGDQHDDDQHDDEYKNWIPSAAERAARPSLGICQGCGRWLDYRTETCTCWNDRHVTKRVISQDEALIAMRAILKLTESSEAEQVE